MKAEVFFYGGFRKLATNSDVRSESRTVVELPEGAVIEDVLDQLGLVSDEVGLVFLNGRPSPLNARVPEGSRLGVFPKGYGSILMVYPYPCWE
ncbi:MAG: hypothetical protein M1358_09815 [Chloroflexi bacterium]|nr:hypothetical protein [Chloroflexota bacterium]